MYHIFTKRRQSSGPQKRVFGYNRNRSAQSTKIITKEEVYATSVGMGSIAGGALDEGAAAEGVGTGRISSTSF
jgi:hypothetical protein